MAESCGCRDEAGRQNKRGRAEARPSPWRAPGRVALPRDLVVGKQPSNCGKTRPLRRVRHRCAPHLAPAVIPQVPRNPSGLGVLSIVSNPVLQPENHHPENSACMGVGGVVRCPRHLRQECVWGGSSVGRALRSQRRGRGFESLSLHQTQSGLKPRGGVAKWPTASDCKSDLYEFDGSNPSPTTTLSKPRKTRGFLLPPRRTRGFGRVSRDSCVRQGGIPEDDTATRRRGRHRCALRAGPIPAEGIRWGFPVQRDWRRGCGSR